MSARAFSLNSGRRTMAIADAMESKTTGIPANHAGKQTASATIVAHLTAVTATRALISASSSSLPLKSTSCPRMREDEGSWEGTNSRKNCEPCSMRRI
jgi:hypothetical protein